MALNNALSVRQMATIANYAEHGLMPQVHPMEPLMLPTYSKWNLCARHTKNKSYKQSKN